MTCGITGLRCTVVLWLLLSALPAALTFADQLPRSAPELEGYRATVITDCDSTHGLSPIAPPQGDYRRFGLTATADARVLGKSVHWQVATDTAQVALLRLAWSGPAPADFVALWLKNPSGHAIGLEAALTLADGGTVELGARLVGDELNWYQLAWPLNDAEVPWAAVDGLLLRLTGLQPATQYGLYLDQVEAYSAPPLPVQVSVRDMPDTSAAGATIAPVLIITPAESRARWPHLVATLERDGFVVAQTALQMPADGPQQGQAVTCPVADIRLPAYLAPGQYELSLGGPVQVAPEVVWPRIAVENPAPPPQIDVRTRPGHVSLLCDDLPVSPLLLEGPGPAQMPARQARPLLVLDATSDFHLYMPGLDVWTAPDSFDYSALDRQLGQLLLGQPDALVMLRVYVGSPPWWDDRHTAELVKFADGSTQAPERVPGRKHTYPSWASERWREDAAAALERLVEHVETGPAGRAVVGYLLCSGEWGNWQYPGAGHELFADYGSSQQRAYQQWLRARYGDLRTDFADAEEKAAFDALRGQHGELAALRAAWGQPVNPMQTPEAIADGRPILTWSQVQIPAANQRRNIWAADRPAGFPGVLRDPVVSQETIDYDRFASELVVETIEWLADAVKQAAPEKLCGARYGHLFDQARYRYALQNGGHQAIWLALQSPHLDFFAAPSVGMPGQAGDLAVFGTVQASLAAHGKLLLYEWPSYVQRDRSERWLRNQMAQALCAAANVTVPAQWMTQPLGPQLSRAADVAASANRESVAEIAVIVDDISVAYTSCGNDLTGPLLDEQRRALTLLGAPLDVWLLDDVLAGRSPAYKMYVVLNAFYLTGADRQALREQVSRERATVVYVYAAGLIERTIGGRTAKDLTGLSIVRLRGAGPLQVALPEGRGTYGARGDIEPRFVASEGLGGGLGQLVGTPYGGLVAMDTAHGKVVWSSAPNLPASVLRDLARQAGVHLYTTDGSAVYACRELLAVRAATDGPLTVHLPDAADVHDCFSGDLLIRNSRRVQLHLNGGDTALLQLVNPVVD